MTNSDHTTRTLLLSKFAPEMLVVSRGSTSNIDPLAEQKDTGHAQVKAFNMSNMNGPFDFVSEGTLLAWGVRNDVGIDEDPITGRVYTVENSVDQMTRNGQDIHNTNPAEELNFIGYLNGTPSSNEGRNFGYPECYTAWDIDTIPDFNGKVGQQFAIGKLSSTNNDSMCSEAHKQAPRLPFHPHMAPLDILFNDDGTTAWVTFHGELPSCRSTLDGKAEIRSPI
jgi:glucose/arabinose dehydrogenase